MDDAQESTCYDAKDPIQLRAFDERLWEAEKAAREFHEADMPALEKAALGSKFGVNHTPIWELVAVRDDLQNPDQVQVWLRIIPKGQAADVEVRLVSPDGAEQFRTIPGLKLITRSKV